MTHVRQQIREQAVVELDAGIPEFVEVASTRLYAYRESQLPSLNVFTATEESEAMTMGAALGTNGVQRRLMRRPLQLVTEIYCTSTTDEKVEDEMDRLAVEVEKVLQDTLLADLAQDITLVSSDALIDAEGEIPVGINTLTWRVIYRTLEGDPETSV